MADTPIYKEIQQIQQEVANHNIYDDKLRERIWNKIQSLIDHCQNSLDQIPTTIRRYSILNLYIKQLSEEQNCVL